MKGIYKFPACFSSVDLAKCTADERRDESSDGGNLNHNQLFRFKILVFHSPSDAQNFRHRGDFEAFTGRLHI